jgi:hypothetical protein
VRWHRAFFVAIGVGDRARGGRPQIQTELRVLLKLGFQVAKSSIAKYSAKRRGPSQGWCTLLRYHVPNIAAIDAFVVPTIGVKLLYGFVVVRLDRRDFA